MTVKWPGGPRVAVIVPALNEAGSVAGLVADVLQQGVDWIFVVDNGSTDATARMAAEAGAIVISEPRRGYGHACSTGSAAALDTGADILVYIDADQSSRADEMGLILKPIVDNEADLVLGSRVLGHIEGGAMAPHQRFGNWLAARLMRRLYGLSVTDLGPYRAIRASTFGALDMTEMTYGWPSEMIVQCTRSHQRVVEVPVTWRARHAGRSKVSGTIKGSVLAGYHILGVTLRGAWPRVTRKLRR